MAAKNKFMNAMKMPAIADMFSSEADRQRESGDLVTEVPLSELHPFVNHPFEVRDDEDMQKLVDSIKENGVLTNLTVRPRAEGGYEIISGHRRFHAAQLAGLDKIKVQVRDVDDDQAIIDMVDANIQREHISPMEKARAYAMKLEAIILSFQKWDGLAKMTPLGWKNYARLLTDDVFYLSVWNTIRIWIFNFVPQMLTALLLSALFTFNHIRGMKFFRAAYYLPNLITAASVGLLFNLLFDGNKSVANYILQALHVKGAPFSFFNSGAFTSGMTSYIQWWMWFGYTTVIVMAGITTIEGSVYLLSRLKVTTIFA